MNIFPVYSPVMDLQTAEELIESFGNIFNLKDLNTKIIKDYDMSQLNRPFAFLILSGGTEHKVMNMIEKSEEPCILISHPEQNSFPAALEILARLKQLNKRGEIIFVNQKGNGLDELKRFLKIIETRKKIKEGRTGLIGKPSDWLVAGKFASNLYEKIWGLKIIDIPIEEITERFQNIKTDDALLLADEFSKNSSACVEPDSKDITEAVKLYLAIKEIREKYKLTSLTLRCFDILKILKTTGCYALSKLNDEGCIAGCEGDLPATLTMLWMYYLTGEIPFMANPQEIDTKANTLSIAHCTVAIRLLKSYRIRSHFESSIGVGIEGEMEEGKITIGRIGGKELEKIFLTEGNILCRENHTFRCRTQLKMEIEKNVSYFLENPLGNHHVIIRGHWTDLLYKYHRFYIERENP